MFEIISTKKENNNPRIKIEPKIIGKITERFISVFDDGG
jgi:hypothetical protein